VRAAGREFLVDPAGCGAAPPSIIFTGPWAGAGAARLGWDCAAARSTAGGAETLFVISDSGGTRVGIGGRLRVMDALSPVWLVVGGGATCGSGLAVALVRSCRENKYQKNRVLVSDTAVISHRTSNAFPPALRGCEFLFCIFYLRPHSIIVAFAGFMRFMFVATRRG
jgi:hypothetical protein